MRKHNCCHFPREAEAADSGVSSTESKLGANTVGANDRSVADGLSPVALDARKEFSMWDGPRERSISVGVKGLSDCELVACLLGTGTRKEGVMSLSQRLLDETRGLRQLSTLHPVELMRVSGLGHAKATRLLASCEVGRRLQSTPWKIGECFSSSKQVFDHCHLHLRDCRRERFMAFYLDARNRLISEKVVSIGTLVASLVHPREVFRLGIQLSAVSLICVHNHPSGDPGYSEEDLAITQRLHRVGQTLGIELLDHIIIGDQSYTSFLDSRISPFKSV